MKETKSEVLTPKPQPRLQRQTRRWNKAGNWLMGIGFFGYFYVVGFHIDPEPDRHSLEEIDRIFFVAVLALIIGFVIRTRWVWTYLTKLLRTK